MRLLIPAPVIAVCAEIASQRETHASLDSLFMYAGAPGEEPPPGSKHVKALEWLRAVNRDTSIEPMAFLGRFLEGYMEEEPPQPSPWENLPAVAETADQERLRKALARHDLKYVRGGLISRGAGMPSRTLEDHLRRGDMPAVELEFDRALANAEKNPREAVSAASNILESLCKQYIADKGLEMPAKQDLKPVWTVVRKDLGFDPSRVEDQDLQTILTGLFAVVDGIGALRTHASSAHGAGLRSYKLHGRHARLAIHAAHTVTLYVLESWKNAKPTK